MNDWQPTKLRDFFFHYDFANPDHVAAVDLLQKHAAEIMNDNAEWVKTFRGALGDTTFLGIATEIIAEFEGFRSTSYKCPAGVWTIGYGSTYYSDGTLVTKYDTPVSKDHARKMLKDHIDNAVVPYLEKIPTWGIMNQCQKAAIVSFAYNLGSHFYGNSGFQTITKALSSKANWSDVPSALLLYVNPGSSFEAGLRLRRQAEAELWNARGKFAQ